MCRPPSADAPSAEKVSCKPCPLGASCHTTGTTTATLNISVGWYRTSSSSEDLRRCPDGANSNSGCVGGIGNKGPCKACAVTSLACVGSYQEQDPALLSRFQSYTVQYTKRYTGTYGTNYTKHLCFLYLSYFLLIVLRSHASSR